MKYRTVTIPLHLLTDQQLRDLITTAQEVIRELGVDVQTDTMVEILQDEIHRRSLPAAKYG